MCDHAHTAAGREGLCNHTASRLKPLKSHKSQHLACSSDNSFLFFSFLSPMHGWPEFQYYQTSSSASSYELAMIRPSSAVTDVTAGLRIYVDS
jgi:hypothetical protein